MNKLVHLSTAGALLAFSAAAQEQEQFAKMQKAKAEAEAKGTVMLKTMGAVRGMTVKNAPYSADEVNETNQMLADGTRIHRENKTTVYRDSEGRTRRETPDNITITDPVAGVTYLLDPKTMTGQKLTMAAGNFTFLRTDGPSVSMNGSNNATFSIHTGPDGPATITVNGVPMDEKAVAEAMAKAKASGSPQTMTYERREVTIHDSGAGSSTGYAYSTGVGAGAGVGSGGAGASAGGVRVGGVVQPAMRSGSMQMMKRTGGESLGKQTIEGVSADGTREVMTIPAGAIGNDRPIQTVNESWYSDELQMMVMSKHSDPRTGDETFRLTNVRRGEPGAYLFQAPSGYQITERK